MLKETKHPDYNEAIRTSIKLYLNSMSGKLVESPDVHYSTRWNAESDLQLNGVGIQKVFKTKSFNRWLLSSTFIVCQTALTMLCMWKLMASISAHSMSKHSKKASKHVVLMLHTHVCLERISAT
jgi:hypothetical protein